MSWIETFDGGSFDFANPHESTVRIVDIATALSRIPRFNGHSLFHYTVAQHCVLMEQALLKLRPESTPLDRLHILLHDASEAYMGDMCRPLKYLPGMKAFRDLEAVVTEVIYKRLGVPTPTAEEEKLVKEFDDRMLRTEAEALMTRIEDWRSVIALEPLPVQVLDWGEEYTRERFLEAYAYAENEYKTKHT